MKKKILIIAFLALSAFAGAQTTLDTAVNFTVKDVDGVTHRLDEYLSQGKSVLVEFFTITCGPCITYAPEINAAYEDYGCNHGDIVFLGINWGANNQQVIEFGETYGARYPKVSGLEGNGNHVVADYQVISYPTLILIEPGGLISEQYIWPPTHQHIDSVLAIHGVQQMPCNTMLGESRKRLADNLITNVFPNPATGFFTIETSSNFEGELIMMSVMGQTLHHQAIATVAGQPLLIAATGLPGGFYRIIMKRNGMIVGSASIVICTGN
ncbi:MAG TPA: TlpA disulfide reductase family protein [Bacteroidales bacterium]|nr:TlpA disulfide reductase family protein [Bacteroidales bacterium]